MVFFLSLSGSFVFLQHSAKAWPPEQELCPFNTYGGNNTGPMDGRCHQARTVSAPPDGKRISRGEVLNFDYEARASTGGSDVEIISWANIDMQPAVGTLSGSGVTSTLLGCISARDSLNASQRYNCGPNNIGRMAYAKDHLSAGEGNSRGIVFSLTVDNRVPDGAQVCVRFHTALFNTQSGNYGYDVGRLVNAQGTGQNTSTQIQPVYAISEVRCYTVNVPNTNPPPPPPNPIPGTASCSTSAPAAAQMGQTVTIDTTFSNLSNSTDWYVGRFNGTPSSQHSGILFAGNTLGVAQASTALNDYANGITNRLPQGHSTLRQFNVSSGTPGTQTYYFGIRNDSTGALFGPPQRMCAINITWSPGGTIDVFECGNTKITPPGVDYTLRFTEWDNGISGAFWDMGVPANQPIDNDTFTFFNFWRGTVGAPPMLPHHVYTLELIAAGTSIDYEYLNGGRPCMDASCNGSINANAEPGETFSASYGIQITNKTNQDYGSGTYSARVTAYPGLSMTPNPGTTTQPFNNGSTVNLSGPWNLTAAYGGSLTASLFYGSTNIDTVSGGWSLACNATYTPETRPFLRVTNGDISTGGGFAYPQAVVGGGLASQCPVTTNAARYISPLTGAAPGNAYRGGIKTFSDIAGGKGSSVDFAAYALGIIHGASDGAGGAYGFISSTARPTNGNLYFANTTRSDASRILGGELGGINGTAHCATDYFNTTRSNAAINHGDPGAAVVDPNLPTGQHYYKGNNIKIGGSTISAGKSVTIYVDGNVEVTGPIKYGNWSFDMTNHTNNAPYLVIIASGNINIDNNVNQIDGVYVAQPKSDASGGIFATCAIAGVPATKAQEPSCNSLLTINGAVIAQHVYALRSKDTVRNNNPAEIFNFNPSTVLGIPNFVPKTGAEPDSPVNSLSNLPPVF